MFEIILNLLYPRTCPLCGRVSKTVLCPKCAEHIPFVENPRCMRCGKPIHDESAEYCYDCSHTSHYYDRGLSLWLHQERVRFSVYQFKYHNRRIYSGFYAAEMERQFARNIEQWKIELIMPIPLYKKRRRERGYNQAEILARELSKLTGIPSDARHLCRVHNTEPQKRLDARARKRNLKKAFAVQEDFHPVSSVLLIDDIYTTGNTIDNAARVLKEAGVSRVYFLTISIGQGY